MNAREYNQAVDQYADGIYRFLLKHTRNESSAQDIVQETFMKVWDKHRDIDAEKIKSYLFTTAYHTMINWIKTEKRIVDTDVSNLNIVSTQEISSEFDLGAILEWALDKLPEIQKSVVLLRDYEGYSYKEIADITTLNESQVKVYIFRARKALKEILNKQELVA
ncbi:MAG: RNA polymerase sigma factor [Bacteroidetes bacterium]|nr:MAG: RNA polymerase sigma factor [Bacteroidota bacterium]